MVTAPESETSSTMLGRLMAHTYYAFATILEDGSVVTWGHPDYGGNSSRAQDQLINVQQICGTHCAFAAILADGTVVTWVDPNRGGDSSRVGRSMLQIMLLLQSWQMEA